MQKCLQQLLLLKSVLLTIKNGNSKWNRKKFYQEYTQWTDIFNFFRPDSINETLLTTDLLLPWHCQDPLLMLSTKFSTKIFHESWKRLPALNHKIKWIPKEKDIGAFIFPRIVQNLGLIYLCFNSIFQCLWVKAHDFSIERRIEKWQGWLANTGN